MASKSIKLYGYKKCSTCRKAEKALQALDIDYNYIDITERPPSASSLKKWAKSSGIEPKKLFNTSGVQYRELNIKAQLPDMSAQEMFALLASNGRLIKRPIVTDGEGATVGFKEAEFVAHWQ